MFYCIVTIVVTKSLPRCDWLNNGCDYSIAFNKICWTTDNTYLFNRAKLYLAD